jgi:hypothetical protein
MQSLWKSIGKFASIRFRMLLLWHRELRRPRVLRNRRIMLNRWVVLCCLILGKLVSRSLWCHDWLSWLICCSVLLYIHRSFFAQAIIENPVNPLKSAYAPSFLAAYRASQTILRTIQQGFQEFPSLCARFWNIWTFAFSAAVSIFGFDVEWS